MVLESGRFEFKTVISNGGVSIVGGDTPARSELNNRRPHTFLNQAF
jgi:hypothetical protein